MSEMRFRYTAHATISPAIMVTGSAKDAVLAVSKRAGIDIAMAKDGMHESLYRLFVRKPWLNRDYGKSAHDDGMGWVQLLPSANSEEETWEKATVSIINYIGDPHIMISRHRAE